MRKIEVLDTTLRDGEQAPGFSMNLNQKLEIAKQLERMQVDVIEAGFPIASADDFNATAAIAKAIKSCSVSAFCRAIPHDITRAYEAVKYSNAPRIHIFLATSDIHLEHKLKITREELIERAVSAVRFARNLCYDIQFTAEDATRTDLNFLARIFQEVEGAGATILNIADTVGYSTPSEFAEIVRFCKERATTAKIGVHCHNDLGMATANALSAVKAGAEQVDCSINGIGERAGMTALEEFVMALRTRNDYFQADTNVVAKEFYRASKLLSNTVGVPIPPNKAIVGANAFSHEAGIHQHGMMANPLTYEIMCPEDVGVRNSGFVLGKHSGKAALQSRLNELGYHLTESHLEDLFSRYKLLADSKAAIADEDLERLVYGHVNTIPHYNLISFVVNSGTQVTSSAVVRLSHSGIESEEVAIGETAVIAAFNAVDKIVQHSYPLHHFTIQSISEGRKELGESSVQIWHEGKIITGRGIDTDIIEACIKAYLNAINKAISLE